MSGKKKGTVDLEGEKKGGERGGRCQREGSLILQESIPIKHKRPRRGGIEEAERKGGEVDRARMRFVATGTTRKRPKREDMQLSTRIWITLLEKRGGGKARNDVGTDYHNKAKTP